MFMNLFTFKTKKRVGFCSFASKPFVENVLLKLSKDKMQKRISNIVHKQFKLFCPFEPFPPACPEGYDN